MQDRVADVLAQRAALDRGAGAGVVVSVLLHGALAGAVAYAALHSAPPRPVTTVNIQFAPMPSVRPAEPVKKAAPPVPKLEEPKPAITEPKPEPVKPTPPPKPEKNTVPLSPFGQSTKKGSEQAPAPPPAAAAPPTTSTAPDVPVGGSGVTGIEGGDFPYALYLNAMHKKIGSYWYRPNVPPGTATIVYFRVARDGTISEAKIATPSGNSTFDRSALSAVRSASPLNPLPYAYSGTYLGVHLTFR